MSYMLMPSEVARLVYGYIDDLDGCKDVAKQFLETCPLLCEFAEGYRRGTRYSVKINNRTLLDFLSNPPDEVNNKPTSMQLHHSANTPIFNEDLLITTVTNAITKAFETASRKQAEDHCRSFHQIQEDQAELKSLLLNSVHNDLLLKIQDIAKVVENNIIHSLHEQSKLHQHSVHSDLQKTPKNIRKYHGFSHHGLSHSENTFSPAAHSSMINTPRRKSFTPRRLYTPHSHNQERLMTPSSSRAQDSPATSTQSQSPYTTDPPSQYSAVTSSPAFTESSEIDIQSYIDKPLVVNRFIQSSTTSDMANRIAHAINQARNSIEGGPPLQNIVSSLLDNVNSANQQQQLLPSPSNNIENGADPQCEFTYAPQQMQELLENATNVLNDDCEYNQLVNSVILSTPFKMFEALTPSSATTSHGSLNTPNIFADMDGNSSNKENADNLDLIPVKNFAKALATPEKNNINSVEKGQPAITLSCKEVFGESTNNNTSLLSEEMTQDKTVIEVTKPTGSSNEEQSSPVLLSGDESAIVLSNASLNQSKSLLKDHSHTTESSNRLNLSSERFKQSSTSKAVFLNQHLKGSKPSFSKLMASQKSVRKSINYSGPVEVKFDSKFEKKKSSTNAANSSQNVLTTTIDKVSDGQADGTSSPSQLTSVHAINLNNFQISNNQVISAPPVVMSQPSTSYFLPTTTIWDPSTAMTTTTEPIYVLQDGLLYNFQPQITSTSQNVYLPVAPKADQTATGQQVIAPAPANNFNSSMPILSCLPNEESALNSGITIDLANHESTKKSSANRPSILSKSEKKKSSVIESPYKAAPLSNVSLTGSEASPLRSRKEPRKSDLGKRMSHGDDIEEPTYLPPASLKRKNESLSNKAKKVSRLTEAGKETDRVKTLLNTNFDTFLQSVHKPQNGGSKGKEKQEKQSTSRHSSSSSERTSRAEKTKKKESSRSSKGGKAK